MRTLFGPLPPDHPRLGGATGLLPDFVTSLDWEAAARDNKAQAVQLDADGRPEGYVLYRHAGDKDAGRPSR